MNELDIKKLWHSVNEKLDSSNKINKKNLDDISRLKVHNLLSTMKPIKLIIALIGIVWVSVLGFALINIFLYAYDKASLFFLYSATIQVMITAIAVAVYIYQINLIYNLEFSEPVLSIQKKLSKLKLSTLNLTRILFLQLPVWTTFYWNETMFTNFNIFQWIIQGFVTISFFILALWIFFNLKYENMHKKWFVLIMGGKEWNPLLQASEMLKEINDYEKKNNI